MVGPGAPRVPVWLDCDPGHDDAFAITLAAHHPGIDLLGISTVHGNTSVANTTRNAVALLKAMGKESDVAVYCGASSPLRRQPLYATAIHGESDIDGTALLPRPTKPPSLKFEAISAMATTILAQPPKTTFLVATGPLTNVSLLIQQYPQVVMHLKGLSVMGGSFGDGFTDAPLGRCDGTEGIGNITPWAEFNIAADPEAAASVFNNKSLAAKTILAPLDLTHQLLATKDIQSMLLHGKGEAEVGRGKTILRQMLVEILLHFAHAYADVYGMTTGPPLHDPLAVAAVLRDTPYEIPMREFDHRTNQDVRPERFAVFVQTDDSQGAETGGSQTGRTTLTKLPPGEDGVTIPRGIDTSKFWDTLEGCLQRADETNATAASLGSSKI